MEQHIPHLDRLLRTAFQRFVTGIRRTEWHGKEHDCVQRFAMGYLVNACGEHHFLQHASQIGIEMAIAKPPTVGIKKTVPKDLVIWSEPWPKVWDSNWNACLTPLAVIEWKVSRGKLGGDGVAHDRKWLKDFAKANPESVGYSVTMQFGKARDHCNLQVSRFFRTTRKRDWLTA